MASVREEAVGAWLQGLFGSKKLQDEDAGSDELLNAQDKHLLAELRRAGSNLSAPHPIRHYLYFLTGDTARKARETLMNDGYGVEFRAPDEEVSQWSLTATRMAVPTPRAIASMTAQMNALTSELSGENDGWESEVIR